jgi:hypothetical protein
MNGVNGADVTAGRPAEGPHHEGCADRWRRRELTRYRYTRFDIYDISLSVDSR